MADKTKMNKSKKNNKQEEANFFMRRVLGVKKFFHDIKQEVKKVAWPNKKTTVQSTVTVVVIVIAASIILFTVDSVFRGIFTATGFYKTTETPVISDVNVPENPAEFEIPDDFEVEAGMPADDVAPEEPVVAE